MFRSIFAVLIIHVISVAAFRSFYNNGMETVLAMEGETVNIRCKTDTPMAYCGFIDPNGNRYSFSGATLDVGQCAKKIIAAKNDSGEWRCHVGAVGSIGVEIMQRINIRVVGELAAIQTNVTAVHGKSTTILCAATKGLTPLKYCRFEPPNDMSPFSISSDVTADKPILGRYYFPNNKSLDRGDCAVTIRKVKYEDVGVWTCGVGMEDGKAHIDTVNLTVEGIYTMSRASATGITIGAIVIVLAILGFIAWRKRRFLGSAPADGEGQELRHLRRGSPRGSPHISPRASVHVSLGSPRRSRRSSAHVSPAGSKHGSRAASPHVSPAGSPHRSRAASPHVSPHRSPAGSPHVSPTVSPHGSPAASPTASLIKRPLYPLPEIEVQSPSDKESVFST